MKKKIAKKVLILYVLDAIEKATSKEHPISITSIAKVLNQIGVPCERRTISRNIDYLIEYGKPIVKIKGGGVYYDHSKGNL